MLSMAAILVADVVVSLVIGHISDYYNPNIKSTASGFDAALLGIALVILLLTLPKYWYNSRLVAGTMIAVLLLSILGCAFQFALAFYFGGWACLCWIIVSILQLYEIKKSTMNFKLVN